MSFPRREGPLSYRFANRSGWFPRRTGRVWRTSRSLSAWAAKTRAVMLLGDAISPTPRGRVADRRAGVLGEHRHQWIDGALGFHASQLQGGVASHGFIGIRQLLQEIIHPRRQPGRRIAAHGHDRLPGIVGTEATFGRGAGAGAA